MRPSIKDENTKNYTRKVNMTEIFKLICMDPKMLREFFKKKEVIFSKIDIKVTKNFLQQLINGFKINLVGSN